MKKINLFGEKSYFYIDSLKYKNKNVLLKNIKSRYNKSPNLKPDNWPESVHTSIQHKNCKDNYQYFELSGIPLDLVVLINQKVQDLIEIEGLQDIGEFYISEMWYNAYRNGQYQNRHKHSNRYNIFFSGVYYLEIDEEHSSTRFYNPAFEVCFEKILNLEFFTFSPKVKNNNLIIFPSGVPHDVTSQHSRKLRVTISFNVRCIFNEHINYS
jgi:uncharacterized protein (TIGR02466 family)